MELTANHCRLCLAECSSLDQNVDEFIELYHQATGFEIQKTDLPRKICMNCQSFLNQFMAYYDQYSRTEAILGDYRQGTLVNVKEEIIIDIQSDVKEELPEEKTEEVYRESRINFDSLRVLHNPTECEIFVLSFEDKAPEPLPSKEILNFNSEQSSCPISCPYCDLNGSTTYEVTKHATKAHPEENWFLCPLCSYSCLSFDRLRLHYAKTSTIKAKNHCERLAPFSPLKCDYCDFQCCYQVKMQNHCEQFHPYKALALCECGSRFVCRDLKLQHILTRCPTATTTSKLPYQNYINAPPKVTDQKQATCQFCRKNVGKYTLQQHISICKKNPQAKRERGQYRCEHCSTKTFKNKNIVRNHMEGVHMKKIFPCEKCSMSFPSYSTRNYHILTVHDETPYPCEFCGKIFIGKLKRDGHHKVHTSKRIHECQICNRRYKREATLKEHMHLKHKKEPGSSSKKKLKSEKDIKRETDST